MTSRPGDQPVADLRVLVAEILAVVDQLVAFDCTPELEARIASWHQRAGLRQLATENEPEAEL
jgi:hypothetical protein